MLQPTRDLPSTIWETWENEILDQVRTVPGNMHVKFEIRSFNHFGAISTECPKFTGYHGHVPLQNMLAKIWSL